MFRPSGKHRRKVLRLNPEQLARLRLIVDARARWHRWRGDPYKMRPNPDAPEVAMQRAFVSIVESREFGWVYERGSLSAYRNMIQRPGHEPVHW